MHGIDLTTRFANRVRRIATINRQQAFLDALVEARGHVLRTLAATGLPVGTWRRWTQEDPEFRRQYREVREALGYGTEDFRGHLESVVYQRALGVHPSSGGVPDPRAIATALRWLRRDGERQA